jgi:hypothetical protein
MNKKLLVVLGVLMARQLCGSCTDFFYVKRPVVYGAVIHEFVAAENSETQHAEAFGLLKGDEDLKSFLAARKNGGETLAEITFLGTACGLKATAAAERARRYSSVWSQAYQNWILYLTRMGITPVVGKPCRNAAIEIAEDLRDYLD